MGFNHDLEIKEWENPIEYKGNFEESELEKNLIGNAEIERLRRLGEKVDDLTVEEAYKAHMKTVDENIDALKKSAAQDTFTQRLSERTMANYEGSSWLQMRRIPGEKELSDKMDQAAGCFQMAAVSKSHRTKRGKKFVEKAKTQAKMMNEMNAYIWEREAALDDVLEHGRNLSLGTDRLQAIKEDTKDEFDKVGYSGGAFAFFHQVSSNKTFERNEEIGIMAKDVAMFYHQRSESMQNYDDRYASIQSGARVLSGLYNKGDGYKGQCISILRQLDQMDLSMFDYKSNEDFAVGIGDRSFSRRYATLRMYSHCTKLLEDVKDQPVISPIYEKLKLKAELINEILADYENRALLLQSPYYTLLAAKDFDKMSVDELKIRRDQTEDENAKLFLTEYITQKEKKGFTRGKSANNIFTSRMIERSMENDVMEMDEKKLREEHRQKERANADVMNEDILAEMAEKNARPRSVTSDKICLNLPFIIDDSKSAEENEKIRKSVLAFHRKMNCKAASAQGAYTKNGKLNGYGKQIMRTLWEEVNSEQYKQIMRDQAVLEDYRAKVSYLTNLAVYAHTDLINSYLEKMLSSQEYKKAVDDLLADIEIMEKMLEIWKLEQEDFNDRIIEDTGREI